MKKLCLTAIILFLTTVPALAALQSDQWHYFREVRAQKDGFALIATDKDILTHSQKGLPDIRLTAEDGREITYQVVGKERPQENLYPASLMNAVAKDDFSYLTLDLSKTGLLHNQISLDIENREEYLRDVLLEGSNDNQTWSAVKFKDKLFFVLPDLKKNDLSYTPASFRYMRLTIDCRGKSPLNITGARVKYSPPAKDTPPAMLPGTEKLNRTDPKTNNTELVIDLGVKGYQVDYINLLSNGRNFNRQVDIFESDDAKDWILLTSGSIHDYQWPGYQSRESKVVLGKSAERHLKVVINNQDSPPLDIRAEVYGEAPKLLSSLNTGKYTLWYGNPQGSQPKYDLSQFSHLIDKAGLETVQPGPEQVNPAFREKISPKNSQRLLNAAVILAAVVIGFIILRNMRARPSE
ncbi:MAG: DUF3999 family protein [Desulfocucumaceae bacterium]